MSTRVLGDSDQLPLLSERQTIELEHMVQVTPITPNEAFPPNNLQPSLPTDICSTSFQSTNSNATTIGPGCGSAQQREFYY